MFGLNFGDILGIIAIIFLVASFFIGKNAIWGTLNLGIIVCVVVGVVNLIRADEFLNLILFEKILIRFILAGALIEILGRVSKLSKKATQFADK
jgi:hypothetical protein